MGRMNLDFLAFNRGLVSPLALARVDVERTRLSAAEMINWLPKTQGAMRIRPGTKYKGSSKSDAAASWIEFVASTTDTALLELTNNLMRVWISGALLTRGSVSTSISNGSFATSADWTDGSTSGGALTFGGSGLILNATNVGGLAKCTREITVGAGDQNDEHALAINVTRGPVTFRCGSTAGAEDYISEAELGTGRHSLAFTPTGNFHLTFQSSLDINKIVASIAVEAAGTMELVAPWATANLSNVRYEQSADVVFVACDGVQQRRIERRGTGRSWSIITYAVDNGPFLVGPSSGARMKAAATFGNTTLTSDLAFFSSSHVGALFRLFHNGQSGVWRLGREDTVSDVFEMTGVGTGADTADRRLKVVTSGTWTATITVQRSFDGPDTGFRDTATAITTNTTTNVDDTDDNLTVWYRLKIKTGGYTSGTAICTVTYNNGGKTGIARVTAFTSSTVVDVEVLTRFSSTDWSGDWQEGYWSAVQVFPTAAAIYEGRLWWAGGTQIFGSVSDDYGNFDEDTEGDSGPIVRSLGRGPVDVVNFLLPLHRLVMGTVGAELAMHSSSFDEPLTPSNSSAKPVSSQGSALLRAVSVDQRGVFVQRSGKRVFMLTVDSNVGDYKTEELTLLVPDLLAEGVVSVAVQRQPDTRIHCVLGDGTVAILTYEEAEEVMCWSIWQTDGTVEAAMVLPGADEDDVFYHVNRTINGATKRYLEQWALESECEGGSLSWLADCAVSYESTATVTIPVAHLEAEAVVAWANGADLSPDVSGVQATYTVASGNITLASAKTNVVAGLPYTASYISTKLAYAAQAGTALAQLKRVDRIGFILATTHNNGLYFGSDASHLDPLSRVLDDGAEVDADLIFSDFDDVSMPFPGAFGSDPRIYLKGLAPRPVTVLAAVPSITTHEKI